VIAGVTVTPSVAPWRNTVLNVGCVKLGVDSSIVIESSNSVTTAVLQTNSNGITEVVVNGQTSNLPAASAAPSTAAVLIGYVTVTAVGRAWEKHGLNIRGHTLAVGSTITLGSETSATTAADQVSGGGTNCG